FAQLALHSFGSQSVAVTDFRSNTIIGGLTVDVGPAHSAVGVWGYVAAGIEPCVVTRAENEDGSLITAYGGVGVKVRLLSTDPTRSEERRVGKESRYRGGRYQEENDQSEVRLHIFGVQLLTVFDLGAANLDSASMRPSGA